MPVGTPRILHASEAATRPIPDYISLNYADLFKIQHVRNVFPLRPVSFSSLAAYLECPGCALDQRRHKRPRESKQFTRTRQSALFGGGQPDPRLVGTLLHQIINLLHDDHGPVTQEQRRELLAYPDMLTSFIRHNLLHVLQTAEKMKLAMFFDELSMHEETFQMLLVRPLLRYRYELASSRSQIFACAERFQFKLASTRKTFAGHSDWGGGVALVGEFDQIRLRNVGDPLTPAGTPAIIEFKTGLGKKKSWDKLCLALDDDETGAPGALGSDEPRAQDLTEPGMGHALQLAIYWLAFQTRWDVLERILLAKGRGEDVRMPLQQELDLILYNLQDGSQYQLLLANLSKALQALINCIFHLNWAMKSGYAWQASDHTCSKTRLLAQVPQPLIQVGHKAISSEECFTLAREAFQTFKENVGWKKQVLQGI